jgi:uncharacterized membrane protein YhiD involved in acid resistance
MSHLKAHNFFKFLALLLFVDHEFRLNPCPAFSVLCIIVRLFPLSRLLRLIRQKATDEKRAHLSSAKENKKDLERERERQIHQEEKKLEGKKERKKERKTSKTTYLVS